MCCRDTGRTNNFLVIRRLKDFGSYSASPCNPRFGLAVPALSGGLEAKLAHGEVTMDDHGAAGCGYHIPLQAWRLLLPLFGELDMYPLLIHTLRCTYTIERLKTKRLLSARLGADPAPPHLVHVLPVLRPACDFTPSSRGQPVVHGGHGELEVALGQAGDDLPGERHAAGEAGGAVGGP